MHITLDYTAYYPLYNAEILFTRPYTTKDYRYLSRGSHDIENEKYGNIICHALRSISLSLKIENLLLQGSCVFIMLID